MSPTIWAPVHLYMVMCICVVLNYTEYKLSQQSTSPLQPVSQIHVTQDKDYRVDVYLPAYTEIYL